MKIIKKTKSLHFIYFSIDDLDQVFLQVFLAQSQQVNCAFMVLRQPMFAAEGVPALALDSQVAQLAFAVVAPLFVFYNWLGLGDN